MDLENYSPAFTDRMVWITLRCKRSHVDWLTSVWALDVGGDEIHFPHLLCSGRTAFEVDVGTEAIPTAGTSVVVYCENSLCGHRHADQISGCKASGRCLEEATRQPELVEQAEQQELWSGTSALHCHSLRWVTSAEGLVWGLWGSLPRAGLSFPSCGLI